MSDQHFRDYDHSIDDVELSVEFIMETDRAVLVNTGTDEQWIPKSLVKMSKEDPERGDSLEITIPEWFALKEGLI